METFSVFQYLFRRSWRFAGDRQDFRLSAGVDGAAMAAPSGEDRHGLAARLRELRTSGFEAQPLNRKQLGMLLGEAIKRPSGPYSARRVGDFENPLATSPPCAEVLHGYARLFGRTGPPPHAEGASPNEQERIGQLEQELLALRDGADVPALETPPAPWRWKAVAGLSAVLIVAMAVLLIARPDASAQQTFCKRELEIQPSPGSVGVVCAREVLVRPSPGASADQSVGALESGDALVIDRYSPEGDWVFVRLERGVEQGWIQSGWFCPSSGGSSGATACADTGQ